MTELNSLCEEKPLKSGPMPSSPDSNFTVQEDFAEEETSPKIIYPRAPPDGSELNYNAGKYSNENDSLIRKEMGDKDVIGTMEEKEDNVTLNILENGEATDVMLLCN